MDSVAVVDVPFRANGRIDKQARALREIFSLIIDEETVTESGLTRLKDFYVQNDISDENLSGVRDQAFRWAVHLELVSQGSTREDTRWLLHLAAKLEISPAIIDWMEEEISTLTILHFIEKCPFKDIPKIQPESVILKPFERAYAEFPVSEIREESFTRLPGDVSASGGFKLGRGVDYRVGQQKSDLLIGSVFSEISDGFLVITNTTLTFSGTDGFSAEIFGLIGLRIFIDSIQFSTIHDPALRTIKFFDPLSVEYCAVVLSRVLNR
ncbi:MAG: hypothetical protein HKN25_14845 [Pyrinomonadaceae bacterium]|nr:hypothetical protein [Pyrinomonadaceae bacterium]